MNRLIKNILAKIRIFAVIVLPAGLGLLSSCTPYKNIPAGDHLVVANRYDINGRSKNNPDFSPYIRQAPNKKLLFFFPVKLSLYNAARENPQAAFDQWEADHQGTVKFLRFFFSQKGIDRIDSSYVGFHRSLKKLGEPPVLYDPSLASRSVNNIESFYHNQGYFRAQASSQATFEEDKAVVQYTVSTGAPYLIDSVNYDIESEVLRELYLQALPGSLIRSGDRYNKDILEVGEANRLTEYFKQHGVYDFSPEYIHYVVDTNGYDHRAQILVEINNLRRQTSSGTYSVPFHKWRVSRINVYTDFQYDARERTYGDTLEYNGLRIFAREKVPYKPWVLGDAIFFRPGEYFALSDYNNTYKALRALRLFSTVSIAMNPDPDNPQEDIVADIYLNPVKKYAANVNFEISRSSLLGIGTSINLQFTKYNAFRGGEIWNNSLRTTLGSYNEPNGKSGFLNAYEINLTTSLTFPRFLLPFRMDRLIPKRMSPKTNASLSFGTQKNVGLNRNNFSFSWDYTWEQSRTVQHKIGLIQFAYLRNTNKYNYYNIFSDSDRDEVIEDYLDLHPDLIEPNPTNPGEYTYRLENIIYNDQTFKENDPTGHRVIADDLYQFARYTSDFVIPSISYTFTFNNQRYDKSRDFHYLQIETALSGNLLNALAKTLNLPSTTLPTGETVHELFGVPFAQFAKFNVNYSRYLNFGRKKNHTLAYRLYFGLTLPYGNSPTQVPFSESYFGGGVNYERGWRAYELGPGSVSDKTHTYNVGNLKLTASLEYRFPLYKSLYGALFFDTGNIWFTSEKLYSDPKGVFHFDTFLKELSLTSGLGLRYDFQFFVARLDMGLQTVDPSQPEGHRWVLFKNGMSRATFQFALAYPF